MESKTIKILYAVQATGNGHISRASEVIPFLQKYGEVDVLLSGSNCNLPVNIPVKYRYPGISLFYKHGGGLDYWKMAKQLNPFKILYHVLSIPVKDYNMIINDFDALTSLACKINKVKSIHWGHQASFQFIQVPRPQKIDIVGEWILKKYCSGTVHIGMHFLPYEPGILPPVIKESVRETTPTNQGHITIYLPQYSLKELLSNLSSLNFVPIQIFTSEVTQVQKHNHIICYPLGKDSFSNSVANCNGLITAGGFETPAEALYLGKKIIVIPIKGQYEQQCNAAALDKLGVPVLQELTVHTGQLICKYFSLLPNSVTPSLRNPENPFQSPFKAMENKSTKKRKTKNPWLHTLSLKNEIEPNSINRSELGNYYRQFSNEEIVDKMMAIALNYTNNVSPKKSLLQQIIKKLRFRNSPWISDSQIPVSL